MSAGTRIVLVTCTGMLAERDWVLNRVSRTSLVYVQYRPSGSTRRTDALLSGATPTTGLVPANRCLTCGTALSVAMKRTRDAKISTHQEARHGGMTAQ